MAAEAGSPIMQLYHDSSSLFSYQHWLWSGVGGAGWWGSGEKMGCVQGLQCLARTRKRRRLFLKKL